MSRLDAAISEVAYILDCLRALKAIHESGTCNDCRGMKERCDYRPKVGQMVRYNCPFYKSMEAEHGIKD